VDDLFGRSGRSTPEEASFGSSPRRGVVVSWCLFFSVILWFVSSLAQTYTRSFVFETRIENLPLDEALRQAPPATIQAEVEGEGVRLLLMYYSRPVIAVSADVPVLDFAESTRAALPGSVRLSQVWPRYIRLEKERRLTRKVPVALRASFILPPTYALLEPPTIMPDSVVVSGPESLIAPLERWYTEAIPIGPFRDSLLTHVALDDSLADLVTLGVRSVAIKVRASEFTEASVPLDIVLAGIPSGSSVLQLDPPTVHVRFRVPLAQYEQAVAARDFLAIVTYDDIRSDTSGAVAPRIELPHGVLLLDVTVTPERVRYYDILDDR
jgi:hypothetical protein